MSRTVATLRSCGRGKPSVLMRRAQRRLEYCAFTESSQCARIDGQVTYLGDSSDAEGSLKMATTSPYG